MALSQIGNAAGEAVRDASASRRREPVVPSPLPESAAVARARAARALVARPVADGVGVDDGLLLAAIRRDLTPGDPVAALLAGWTAPPVRAVTVPPRPRNPELA